jgi:hypothetical protein
MDATAFYWAGGVGGVWSPRRRVMDRWRGQWYGMPGTWALSYWDGQGLRQVARPVTGLTPARIFADNVALHVFGAGTGEESGWACYAGGVLAERGGLSHRAMAGHATGGRLWLLGRIGTDRATLILNPGTVPEGGPRSAPTCYQVLRVERLVNVMPAVYEARQFAGEDATEESPRVFEARQGVQAAALPEVKIFEARQHAGSDAGAASPSVYEARQAAGRDATLASPGVFEARQGAEAEWLASPAISEARQYASGYAQPAAGGVIRFLVQAAEEEATALLVGSNSDRAEEAGLTAIARGEEPGSEPEVDNWATYQPVGLGRRVELETPGTQVRVGIIKDAAAPVPEIGVIARREAE